MDYVGLGLQGILEAQTANEAKVICLASAKNLRCPLLEDREILEVSVIIVIITSTTVFVLTMP